ncbi:hypothetical protein EUTSA_v10000613mg [Eutrema salsugineum]|uniref:KIB1-4 beta-propeller domain-containing protein n=1 Tax=Eutrema salsugineum TaxID=72664 RepID=V4NJI0_EUTSA|nr:hypothetical protein EUTSA_v10000613mg [Eutrema salsugineum]
MIPDWTQLPQELLHIIKEKLENCFDVVHARSVCTSWRSTFPFPASLLRQSYSLPLYPIEMESLCSLEKIPFFLCRVPTAAESASEYFLGGICRDESEDYSQFPSPPQCSLRLKLPGSNPTLKNMLDCQIFSVGHHYRMICWHQGLRITFKDVAFLPLNKEGGAEFVVIRSYSRTLVVFTSVEKRWLQLKDVPDTTCLDLVAFRGRFYAAFRNKDVFVIDPYLLKATRLMPSEHLNGFFHVIPSGDDELFLVEKFLSTTPHAAGLKCRVRRLDEEAGKWVKVTDLGDRVLFAGYGANNSCSTKQLPDGCGLSRNSIFFTERPGHANFIFKYAAGSGDWELSRESCVFNVILMPVILDYPLRSW